MSHCHKYEEQFSSYIEGELNQESKRHIEQHLQNCKGCQNAVGHIRTIQRSLHAMPRISTSVAFNQQLTASLNQKTRRRSFRSPFESLPSWGAPAIGFAMVVLLVSSVMLTNWSPGDATLNPPAESNLPASISGGTNALVPTQEAPAQTAADPYSKITSQETPPTAADSSQEKLKEHLKKQLKYVKDNK